MGLNDYWKILRKWSKVVTNFKRNYIYKPPCFRGHRYWMGIYQNNKKSKILLYPSTDDKSSWHHTTATQNWPCILIYLSYERSYLVYLPEHRWTPCIWHQTSNELPLKKIIRSNLPWFIILLAGLRISLWIL